MSGIASVTFAQAEEIRRRRAAGERGMDLAAEFGISPQLICDIVYERRRAKPAREDLAAEIERLRQALIPFAFVSRRSMERLGLGEEYDEAREVLGL